MIEHPEDFETTASPSEPCGDISAAPVGAGEPAIIGADGKAWPKTFDGGAWAQALHRRFPAVPLDEAIGWMANALMRGYDEANWRRDKKASASEAVYGFAAWLTCRSEAVTLGAAHEASTAAELVDTYCRSQGFEPPRDDYADRLRPAPPGAFSLDAYRDTPGAHVHAPSFDAQTAEVTP